MENYSHVPTHWHKKVWQQFTTWLRNKEIKNAYDFSEFSNNKWKITSDKRCMHVQHSDGYCKYEMVENNERQIECELISANSLPEPQSNGTIGRFVDNKLNIIDELIANIAPTDDGPNQTVVFTD